MGWSKVVRALLRVLLTNDDGIDAEGLQTLRRALVGLEDIELAVVAPAENQSATARSISIRRPLWVEEIPFGDGTVGYSCDGTPVDCVRLASLGLIDGFEPELIVSGINHGVNLGDDITYSGTVAAALEGVVLGIPGIAVSQQSRGRDVDFRLGNTYDFEAGAAFVARVVDRLDDVPLPSGALLNVNVPGGTIEGIEVARLGKRIYRDNLDLIEEDSGRKLYRVYGNVPEPNDDPGTDLHAIANGRIAVTPLHFDLTAEHGMEALRAFDLEALLES
jgi:5'-nucleotidase